MLKIFPKTIIILLDVILLLNIFAKNIYAIQERTKNNIYIQLKEEDEIANKIEHIEEPNIPKYEVPKHQKSIYIIPESQKKADEKEKNNKIENKKTSKNNIVNKEKSNNNKGNNESKTSQNKERKEQNKLKNINENKKQKQKENEEENKQTPQIYIENDGNNVANIGQNIENDISIRNIGNTNFEKLIWQYEVPTKYVKLKKFNTGTYNQNIIYNLYCKTNLSSDYRLIMEGITSNENFEIDFEEECANDEYVTEIKAEFKETDDIFCSNENPHFISNVLQNIKSESKFVTTVSAKGIIKNQETTSDAKSETFVYKTLPKTGF